MNDGTGPEARAKVPAERPWKAGYSRAIRVGDIIEVSGTVASDADGTPLFPMDMQAQATECLEQIGRALERLGSSHADVTRTRVFLTDFSRWPEAAAAHHKVFQDVLPACSFIGVAELLHPDFLVEIEATAIASRRAGGRAQS